MKLVGRPTKKGLKNEGLLSWEEGNGVLSMLHLLKSHVFEGEPTSGIYRRRRRLLPPLS